MPTTTTKIVDLNLLSYYDSKLKTWVGGTFKLVEQATADDGYLKTYKLQFNGVDVSESAKINIPKDFFLKSMTIETCAVDDEPEQGYVVGDKYFDMVINVSDDSATPRHVYLKLTDAFVEYIEGNGIDIDGQTISVKVGDGIAINATTKAVEAKVGTGLEINTTSKAIDLKAQNATSTDDANAPAVGGVTKADYVGFKGAVNALSAGTETAPTADTTKNETVVTKTHTIKGTTVGNDTPAELVTTTEYYVTYGNALPTTGGGAAEGGTDAKAGLMSGLDKDNLDAIVTALGTDIGYASNTDIDDLFNDNNATNDDIDNLFGDNTGN